MYPVVIDRKESIMAKPEITYWILVTIAANFIILNIATIYLLLFKPL